MGEPVDEKFRKMQDEMSRFEEEIGLPLPSVPLPPNEPMPDQAPPMADIVPPTIPMGPGGLPPHMGPNGLPPLAPNLPPPPPPQYGHPPMLHGEGDFLPPPMFPGLPPMPPGMGLPPLSGPLPPGMPPMPPIPPGGPLPPMPPVPPMPGQGLPPMSMPMPMPGGRLPMPGNPFQPPQGMMGPPSNMFQPPMQPAPPPIEEKVTPAIVSATPMLYVANPQLEIAAIQAERTPPFEEPQVVHIERKSAQAKPADPAPANKKKDKKNRKCIRTAGGTTWEDSTLAEWDDDDFRLFCGDLGNDVTDEVLSRAFSKYASFTKAKVIRDKRTNKTKGFGFVSFKDPQDFIRATKEMNGRYVGSRPIKLRKSTWRNRCLDVVRKKDKEKQQLISMLTGR